MRGQLHAGQLRYHDFSKLRELQNARNNVNGLFISPLGGQSFVSGQFPSLPQFQQSRSLVNFSMGLENLQLKGLEAVANSRPSDVQAQYEFLSKLAHTHPQVVIDRVGHPMFRHFAVDSRIVTLYLQAMTQTQRFNSFNLEEIAKRLQEHEPAAAVGLDALIEESRTRTKGDQASALMQFLHGGGMGVPGMASLGAAGSTAASRMGGLMGSARGTDPKVPLHVQLHNPTSTRVALITLAGRVLIAFGVVYAFVTFMDEKGVGRSLGMNSNSNHVQQAQDSNVSFDDVKGVDEAKAELQEIVMYLKNPTKFTRLGGKLPRGLLLTGPPGTGKTLLAKAIAGEADVPFFFSSGSQFEEVYVGLGAKRIRELFEAAKKVSPCIIFIDEIDAVGGNRKLKDQSALKMTLNELLVQMDGFEDNSGIIVIGATNFMESLDSALLRPGRFDKHITVPLPDVGGRKEILEMYAKKTKLHPNVDLNVLARGTTGFSGADLFNLMNQAALKASVDGLNNITMSVLEYAKDKILMGAERKTAVITKKTAKCTAYHEAGHALVAALTDGAMPIHKATIMPRGQALGMVTMLPEGDQTSQSLKEMIAMMDVSMGGRVAEELIFGRDNATSGAMSDIQNATKIARALVTKYGFSEEIGLVNFEGSAGEENASDETRNKIDNEVKRLTDASYKRAKDLLTQHSRQHHLLATTLLEYETLTGEEVRDLIEKGVKPKRPVINKDGGARGYRDVVNESSSKGKSRLPGLGLDTADSSRE
eukprot:Nitzschia sp. Nitz4//scaffold10_size219509//103934//106425//NITZ4_001429-RA/size219509-augustus-gene-0.245-mRNA-1//1//CDS//3329532923//4788//frame0